MAYVNTLKMDNWNENIIDQLVMYRLELRKEGIVNDFPESLKLSGNPREGILIDKNHQEFGSLRGKDCVMNKLAQFVNERGGNYSLLTTWGSRQGIDETSDINLAFKYNMFKFRKIDASHYFFTGGLQNVENKYNIFLNRIHHDQNKATKIFENTWCIWLAFNIEFLTHVDFPGRDPINQTVKIYRTQDSTISYFFNTFSIWNSMKRANMVSGSIIEPVMTKNASRYITVQNVPFHRIYGNYMFQGNVTSSFFLSDAEKEFIYDWDKYQYENNKKIIELSNTTELPVFK